MRIVLIPLILYVVSQAVSYGQVGIDYGAVYDAAYSHDGTKIATATDRGLQIWNAEPFELIDEYVHEGGFHVLKWSPKDLKVYAGYKMFDDTGISILYVLNEQKILQFKFKLHLNYKYPNGARGASPFIHNNFVSFNIDETKLAFVSESNTVQLLDLNDGSSEIIPFNITQNIDMNPYSVFFNHTTNELWIGIISNKFIKYNFDSNESTEPVQIDLVPDISSREFGSHNPFYITYDFKYCVSYVERWSKRTEFRPSFSSSLYSCDTLNYIDDLGKSSLPLFSEIYKGVVGNPIRVFYSHSMNALYVFDEEPIRQYNISTSLVGEIEGFKSIEFTSYFTQPFSPDGTKVLSDDYPAISEFRLDSYIFRRPNVKPKGPDLFKNNFITGDKTRLLPLPTAVKNYEKYD